MSDTRNALKARSMQPAFSGLYLSGIGFQPMTLFMRLPYKNYRNTCLHINLSSTLFDDNPFNTITNTGIL